MCADGGLFKFSLLAPHLKSCVPVFVDSLIVKQNDPFFFTSMLFKELLTRNPN